jgi:hypothetical protein
MNKNKIKKIEKMTLEAKKLDELLWQRARKLSYCVCPYDLDPELPSYNDMQAKYEDLVEKICDLCGCNDYKDALELIKNKSC